MEVLEAVRPVETPWQVSIDWHTNVMSGRYTDIGRLARGVPHCVIVTAAGLRWILSRGCLHRSMVLTRVR
ncbi:MAG: hypothetical protein CM15mP103_04940 [Gammaproteobacteria bacterium]|nr:MAG: hypothetical protein CM15mP103_04940 [Gammaproteobacteria bacterium]